MSKYYIFHVEGKAHYILTPNKAITPEVQERLEEVWTLTCGGTLLTYAFVGEKDVVILHDGKQELKDIVIPVDFQLPEYCDMVRFTGQGNADESEIILNGKMKKKFREKIQDRFNKMPKIFEANEIAMC